MKIGLVGNQNSGKTTLFNLLTGMNAKIGNWPGVTIEKKSGTIKNTNYEITDLPGIYSLSPYSVEEEVSRKFIFEEKPDVIINIVDSTSLERSLYLTTQLLELDTKVIIALNMADVLEKKGIQIDINKLEKMLGAKVLKISALKGTGIDELIKEIKNSKKLASTRIYDQNIENAVEQITRTLPQEVIHKRFVAIKLLESDERFRDLRTPTVQKIDIELSSNYNTDLEETIATKRYNFIENAKKVSFKQIKREEPVSDKLDKIFLNKWLSFPIFVIIMFLVYYLSTTIIFLSFANVIRTQYLIPKEQDKDYIISVFLGAVVNLVINLILIPQYQSIGACIGTVVAEFIVMLYQIIIVRKQLPIFDYLKGICSFFIKSMIMFIITLLIKLMELSSILTITIQIIVGVLVYVSLNWKYINNILDSYKEVINKIIKLKSYIKNKTYN